MFADPEFDFQELLNSTVAAHDKRERLGPELKNKIWWAHQDSNLGPTDYESVALTN